MDLEFNKEAVLYQKKVCDITFTHEQTQEAIVPDALPDIYEILCTYANVCLRGKDTDTGRVTVTGSAETSVLFSAENGERVRSLSASIPFSVSADAQGITNESSVITDITVSSAEAKMINPRKVLIKVNLNIMLKCYNEEQLYNSCTAPEEAGIEILSKTASTDTVKNVTEKTFIISDEYNISGSKAPLGEILSYTTRLYTEEVKAIGSKLIVSGRVGSNVIYLADTSGIIECAEFSTMFSQIIELPDQADEQICNTELMLTGAYYNIADLNDFKGISVEVHVVAQCETISSAEINYIADIFSTTRELECETYSVEISENTDTSELNEMLRGTLPLEISADKILRTDFTVSVASLSEKDNALQAELKAFASVLYISQNGNLKSVAGNISSTVLIPNSDLKTCSVRCCAGDEIYVTPAGMEMEIRIPVSIRVVKYEKRVIECVESVTYSDGSEDSEDRPSVILYKTQENDSMWSISKRFRSTRRAIAEANSLENFDKAEPGTLLLIPRSR